MLGNVVCGLFLLERNFQASHTSFCKFFTLNRSFFYVLLLLPFATKNLKTYSFLIKASMSVVQDPIYGFRSLIMSVWKPFSNVGIGK